MRKKSIYMAAAFIEAAKKNRRPRKVAAEIPGVAPGSDKTLQILRFL